MRVVVSSLPLETELLAIALPHPRGLRIQQKPTVINILKVLRRRWEGDQAGLGQEGAQETPQLQELFVCLKVETGADEVQKQTLSFK